MTGACKRFVTDLLEGTWDPSKHPRGGFSQNRGWFSPTGGNVTSHETGKLQNGNSPQFQPRKVKATQVAWLPPVGHHWIPISVLLKPDIRAILSDDAFAYGVGAFSGSTIPSHRNTAYGSVQHKKYSELVEIELRNFIKHHKIETMTPAQMEEFVNLTRGGKNAFGQPHDQIGVFNKAIKNSITKDSAPSKFDDIVAAGRKYMKHSRFKLLAAGAVIAGTLGEVVAQEIKVLEVAAESGHFRRAMRALDEGDIGTAHLLLTGENASLYNELLVKVGSHAALNFKKNMDRVFEKSKNRIYK